MTYVGGRVDYRFGQWTQWWTTAREHEKIPSLRERKKKKGQQPGSAKRMGKKEDRKTTKF